MRSYNILGLMSGTSLDGLDISYCEYKYDSSLNKWSYKLFQSETIGYPSELVKRLSNAKSLDANEIGILDQELGEYFSQLTLKFITDKEIEKSSIDLISSHGHTIFHQPEKKFTLQIGCGETLATRTGIKVVNDFRTKDVINGGQGAPLVPIGDKLLFNSLADTFLNIGGFTNICILGDKIKAFDIGPGNLPINYLANSLGFDYDKNGDIAKSGEVDNELLAELNQLPYYHQLGPKSLGTEWLEKEFMTIINKYSSTTPSKMRTVCEHEGEQIANVLNSYNCKTVMITGGGAKNTYLINCIKKHTKCIVNIPDQQLIDFKEAIVFGFLGALYMENIPNCLSEVTGASHDVIGGTLHLS